MNSCVCAREDGHGNRRSNAILIHGPPIRHLSTDKVFAYSGHYATAAEQIEWSKWYPTGTYHQVAHIVLCSRRSELCSRLPFFINGHGSILYSEKGSRTLQCSRSRYRGW